MQIENTQAGDQITSLKPLNPPPPQRCVKIAQILIILITCLGIAACITAGIFSPTLPSLLVISGVLSALISIVLFFVFIKKVLTTLHNHNERIINGINLLRGEGNRFEEQQNSISDSLKDLTQKHKDLNKDYLKNKSKTQDELNKYKTSLNNLENDFHTVRRDIATNAKRLELLNPNNKKGFVPKLKDPKTQF